MKASGQGSVAAAKKAAETTPVRTLAQYLESQRDSFLKAAPGLHFTHFAQVVLRAVYTNPKLAQCSHLSIAMAAMESAALGLEPGGVLGHAALVPYWNSKKGCYEAQFQPMYRGLILLAYKHGIPGFKIIDAQTVYENDKFSYIRDPEPTWTHVPAKGNRGAAIGYYAYYIMTTGGIKFEYMSFEEVHAWAKQYSPSYADSDGAWQNSFDPMALKTVLRKILKYAPINIALPADPDIDKTPVPLPLTEDTIPVDYEVVEDQEKSKASEVPNEEQDETNKDNTFVHESKENPSAAGFEESKQPELFK